MSSYAKHVIFHTHTSSRILLIISPLTKTFVQMVVTTTIVGTPAVKYKMFSTLLFIFLCIEKSVMRINSMGAFYTDTPELHKDKVIISVFNNYFHRLLRKRITFSVAFFVLELKAIGLVWENEKCCMNISRRIQVFPQLFGVNPSFQEVLLVQWKQAENVFYFLSRIRSTE